MKQPMLIILAICTITLSGCGTFSDMMCGPADDQVFFRGVRLDILAAKEGGTHSFMAADIPLSAAADTLLIPFLAYAETTRSPRQKRVEVTDPAPQANPSHPPSAFPIVSPTLQK